MLLQNLASYLKSKCDYSVIQFLVKLQKNECKRTGKLCSVPLVNFSDFQKFMGRSSTLFSFCLLTSSKSLFFEKQSGFQLCSLYYRNGKLL